VVKSIKWCAKIGLLPVMAIITGKKHQAAKTGGDDLKKAGWGW